MSPTLNNNLHLTKYDTFLEIQFIDTNKILRLYYIWLRDHCRCSQCYNQNTNQIFSDLLSIPLNIEPFKCDIITDNLIITWKDDHKSTFSITWLHNTHFPQPDDQEIVLWDKSDISNFDDTTISANNFFKDEIGVKHLLKSLKKYGFGFVTDVEPTVEATEKVVERVSIIKKTLFGEMWSVNVNVSHQDTAYTTIGLGPHTDNTYFSDASGLQVFHTVDTDGIGGESILVDGFKAAHTLNKVNSSYYEFLCNNFFESQYIETGYHFNNIGSVIKLHPITKKTLQIRYNIHDRAPLNLIPQEKMMTFYEAYQTFGKILNNSNNQLRIKLTPGTVLFFDNWRVLHGRTAFEGKRVLWGCYIPRDDWTSKARTLGINVI